MSKVTDLNQYDGFQLVVLGNFQGSSLLLFIREWSGISWAAMHCQYIGMRVSVYRR